MRVGVAQGWRAPSGPRLRLHETLDPPRPGAALFAEFVRKLAHHLALLGATSLSVSLWTGCGEDSDQRYAGLEVATAISTDGLGYRVRFLSPPWDKSSLDPLVLGTRKGVELRGQQNQEFLAGTATVLEIDRESIVVDTDQALAKYRLEATLHDCDVPLAAGESCAERIAVADEAARAERGEPSFYDDGVKTQTSDFEATFYEIITRDLEGRRSKRVAFFDTPNPGRFLRIYIEANPRLDEAEVTRMLKAVETFEEIGFMQDRDAGGPP